jgi:hypothetical protein
VVIQPRPTVHDATLRFDAAASAVDGGRSKESCWIVVLYRDERRVFDSRGVAIELVTERGARWLADLVRVAVDAGVFVPPLGRTADPPVALGGPDVGPHVHARDARASHFLASLFAALEAAGHPIPPIA